MKLAFSLLLGAVLVGCPRPPPPPEAEPPHRMTWWREARFGMFIHWGLYSTLGGEWEGFDYGKEMEGASAEWIMLAADIPTDDYAALANRFNPTKFDASKWVGIAKDAGMKYFVITSKHHDGFSLFDTELSDYDIIDRSPFKRDVIKELADECARQGIRFGVYYSHSKDWYHRTKRRADPNPPSAKYIEFAQGQVRELLTNYGDIGVLWFDTGGQFKEINGDYGRLVRRLSPRTIIGSRLNADDESLHRAWFEALRFDDEIIAEPFLGGPEYTAAILGDSELPLIRLQTPHELYDYDAKYADGAGTGYHCPCGLDESTETAFKRLARTAFEELGASGWGRVDFVCDGAGNPHFIDVNTAPGMTGHSLVPMAAQAIGVDYDDLVWRILETSVA